MPSKRPTEEAEAGPSMSAIADYDLPKTTVTKIAKSAFEDQTIKFQQDVFLALQKSATVYINYIASAAQEHADAAGRKTLNPQDIILATTEHLSGIGGDANGATELREVFEEELEAFRAHQATVKAAKAAAGPYTGPKRGFPGRPKHAAPAGEFELLDEDEDDGMPVDAPVDGDAEEEDVRIGDGEDVEDDDEEDEVDQELLDALPGSDEEPIEDDDAEMS